MATESKQFRFTPGPIYTGLAATITLELVDPSGNVLAGPISGAAITEQAFGAVTATGDYVATVASFDTSWTGTARWYESTTPLIATEDFAPAAAGGSNVAVDDQGRVTLTPAEHTQVAADATSAITAHYASPIPVRSQDGVTAPTYADAAQAAWSVAFAAQKDNSADFPAQFLVYMPGGVGVGVARTFNLILNCDGQPVGRS